MIRKLAPACSKRWSAGNWIAFSSFIVALCALGVSIYEIRATRDHNRLSVKPHLVIDFIYNQEGVGFLMVNKGLGPALIRSFIVYVDDKPQRTWHMATNTLGLPSEYQWFKRIPNPSTIWRTDEKEPRVFWIYKSPVSDQLLAQKHRVNIKVCYCSMYDDECWYKTRTIQDPQKNSCDEVQNQLVAD